MNIAVIGLRGLPGVQGGIEKHCENLYPYIANYVGDVTVVGRKGYIAPRPYIFRGIKVFPIWSPRSKILETMVHTGLSCLWLLRHRKLFNIVHIHAIGPSLFTPILRLWGFKVVVTNHGPDYDRRKWGWFAKWVLKVSEYIGSKTAHLIIAVSRPIRTQLRQQYAVDAHYIPNGVERTELIPTGKTLSRYDLKEKKYVIGVGRLVPEKGFHDLVAAFNRVRTDWKLALVGAADHEDGYSRSLKAMACNAERVVMTGFQKGNALGELYSNAGIFVLPSYHEGMSIAALEAMSFGLPIVLSNIPVNREVAFPGELFPAGDIGALARLIEKHIAMPTVVCENRMHKERQQRLSSEFSWRRIARQTAGVYAALKPQC